MEPNNDIKIDISESGKQTIHSFDGITHAHFIGIGGIGISAIARMLISRGVKVTGSDQSLGKVVDGLQELGAEVTIGHSAANIPKNVDVVIYTIAIPDTNPELKQAKDLQIPCITYPETLAILSKEHYTIGIAGTHGKTTTTGMVASIFLEAKKDPTVIIGSFLAVHIPQENDGDDMHPALQKPVYSNFIGGKGEVFIVESCEYKKSFLNITPKIAVITNIDDDHLDYYEDIAHIQDAFVEFIDGMKRGGVLITDAKHPRLKPIIAHAREKKIQVIDYMASNFLDMEVSHELAVPGEHNRHNAAAAYEVGLAYGLKSQDILKGLAQFHGTWRRFEKRGTAASGMLVYDDYGHHPTEIKATLEGARSKFGQDTHIIAVFQPHLYSRTKQHFDDFAHAFALANEVIVMPIYAAREPHDPTVSHELLVQAMENAGTNARSFDTHEQVAQYAKRRGNSKVVLLTIGAGDVYKVADLVLTT